jgi:hypothetical protein
MRLKNLPTDTYDFPRLRDPRENLIYIDKTELIYKLISSGHYFFLSRPRRFGKSLLISTLKQLYQGNRKLFTGLAIAATDYDFPSYPVIHLDVYTSRFDDRKALEADLIQKLQDLIVQNKWDVTLESETPRACLGELIRKLSEHGRVVILIDEYDKPILDHLEDLERAKIARDVLQDFYSVIKEHDAELHFVMVTGVSRFSKVSLFSGLNNLRDISNSRDYATLLGITQEELDTVLNDHVCAMTEEMNMDQAELKRHLREWYNGYRFTDAEERVYNPVSLMSALNDCQFDTYWFKTGTPTFLVKQFKKNDLYHFEDATQLYVKALAFDTFDVEQLDLTSLMLQTGYLTIGDVRGKVQREYRLDYPNYEVKHSLFVYLLEYLSEMRRGFSSRPLSALVKALQELDSSRFQQLLQEEFFARIPYDLHIKLEKFYQAMFHILFTLIGMEIRAEESTNLGRMDAVIETDRQVFVIEMKYAKPVAEALTQIEAKQYTQRYLNSGKQVVQVGISFFEDRQIEAIIQGS